MTKSLESRSVESETGHQETPVATGNLVVKPVKVDDRQLDVIIEDPGDYTNDEVDGISRMFGLGLLG